MWPLIHADLRYSARAIAVFYGLTALNVALLLSIQDESDTPPPTVWLPLVMQGVLTFNLLYRERRERRARLYALLPLRPMTVAFARLVRFLLAVLALGLVSIGLIVQSGHPVWFALNVALLALVVCLVIVLLYDHFGLTGVQVGLFVPGLLLLSVLALGSWLAPSLGRVTAEAMTYVVTALAQPFGALLVCLVLGVVVTLHLRLSPRLPIA